MPLPQSRIGKAVRLGIVLGFLVVFAAVAFASVAHAQEAPLPAKVQGVSPYPDSIVCRGWQMFESGEYERRVRDADLSENMASVTAKLRRLCEQAPGDENVGADSAAWLTKVDNVFDAITTALFERMSRPISVSDRAVLRDILQTTTTFQRNFELLRVLVYTAETVKVVESVKTVEVPAACPEPRVVEPPPPPRDACADALRQGADRWSTQLYKWTSWYRGSGDDWALADSSKAEMNNIARGNGDPRSYVIGWLAQWRSIRRQDNTSFLGSGPMPQIAADMRAQLSLCGIYQESDR